jgi:hypothetical protein
MSWRHMEECGYSSTIFDSALGGGEWSASRPGRFTPGEETPLPVPLDKKLGGLHLALSGMELRPVASSLSLYQQSYLDWIFYHW